MLLNTKLLFLSAALFLGLGCNSKTQANENNKEESTPAKNENQESAPKPAENVTANGSTTYLIHLSQGSNDPYRVVLALKMALDLAEKGKVMLYLDHKGTEIAFKETEEIVYAPFPPHRKTLDKLIETGAMVKVCEPCLQASWKKKEDVIKGIGMFSPDDIISLSSGQVLTLSY